MLAGVPLIDLVGVVGTEPVGEAREASLSSLKAEPDAHGRARGRYRRVVVFEYHNKRSLPNGLMSDIMEGGHFDECTELRSARVAIRHPSESDGASEFHRRRLA